MAQVRSGLRFLTALLEIGNTNKNHIEFNIVTGFQNGVLFLNGNGGAQENTISFQQISRCAVGIKMISTNGASICDKNTFTGINGGTGRINAGLALQFDGNARVGYTGAAQWNNFQNLTVERVDSVIDWQGKVVMTVLRNFWGENGLKTGIFGNLTLKNKNRAPAIYKSSKVNLY